MLKTALIQMKEAFASLPCKINQFYIAFSGGLDSHILLHATRHLYPSAHLTAIHINHGWHKGAKQWEIHCQTICNTLNIPLIIERLTISPESMARYGPEEAARRERYATLHRYLNNKDCLLTGHHLEDQAETLLLQLLRGAGIQGLASMPLFSQHNSAYHLRPLLSWTRQDRINYAKQHQLSWIEDSSNLDQRYHRNFIRHSVLPLLKQRWPSMVTTLARTARHCAQANDLSIEIAIQDLATCEIKKGSLSVTALCQLSSLRQDNVLRYWIKKQLNAVPSTDQFLQIKQLVFTKQTPIQFSVNGWAIRRYRDTLYANILLPTSYLSLQTNTIQWNLKYPLPLEKGNALVAIPTYGKGIRRSIFSDNNPILTIQFRQGGERFHPQGRCGSHPLKKLFQEWNIPPWERPHVPLLYFNRQLLAVSGLAVADHVAAQKDEASFDIQIMSESNF